PLRRRGSHVMPNFQLSCPHCRATLNFAQPVPAGTPIPCLICNRTFPAPAATGAAGKPLAAPPKAALANPHPPAAAITAAQRSPAPPNPAAVPAKAPETFAIEPLSGPRRPAAAPRVKTAPRNSQPSGPSMSGRIVGGLVLAAVVLVLLSGLVY